jgi:hypothetical protein
MTALTEELGSRLVRVARSVAGDELRSVTYFDEDEIEQLYLRTDLDEDADLVGFAENERLGFRSQQAYRSTQLGPYRFTIRVFDDGFLTRVIVDDRGVWVTTDAMAIDRFEEVASALAGVFREE